MDTLTDKKQITECYNNQALFSDHYLAERMEVHPEWAEDVREPFAELRALYQEKRDILDGLNKAQTEGVRSCLSCIGWLIQMVVRLE